MNRITNREIEWYYDFIKEIEEDDYYIEEINDFMYRKLKALEDLEEDLGIDLFKYLAKLKRALEND